MKTYLKDFSASNNSLVDTNSNLEELISNRHEKFMCTKEYQEVREWVRNALKEIIELPPKTLGLIEDAFFTMEDISFSAGYRDGVSDLMTAMTFNDLGLTKVETINLGRGA